MSKIWYSIVNLTMYYFTDTTWLSYFKLTTNKMQPTSKTNFNKVNRVNIKSKGYVLPKLIPLPIKH